MQKFIILILCCITLSGCSNTIHPQDTSAVTSSDTTTTSDTSLDPILTPEPIPMEITIYYGNDNADGFETMVHKAYYYNSHTLLEQLAYAGVLNDKVALLSEEYKGTCLHLDFNDEFRDLICSTGSSGEYIIMGSLVNTFLVNYSDVAESIFITVNGEILESGHVIYDFELSKYE